MSIDLLWTATFAVKLSFLAFFRRMVKPLDNIQRYYWGIVGLTIISWMFIIPHPFITCPALGFEICMSSVIDTIVLPSADLVIVTCSQKFDSKLAVVMNTLVTTLDVSTDLMSKLNI